MVVHERQLVTALCLGLALVALALLRPRAAGASEYLVAREPDGRERGAFPLARTEVSAEVSGDIISVDVTQRFTNPYTDRVEAVYTFPLPTRAAVDDMEMRVGQRVVRSVVRRRGEARAAYAEAASSGQRAAIIEQDRPNVFTVSVANIDPGGEIVVRLHYFELARYDHGVYEMAFPMTVGPRYIPGQPVHGAQAGAGTHPDTDQVNDASRISPPHATRSGHTIGLAVRLDGGAALQTVESVAHAVTVERPSPSQAVVRLRDQAEIPNRDFVLRWSLAGSEVRAAMFTHRADAHSDGYFALLLAARHDAPAAEIAPREIFFLMDTSGSMQGPPLEAAKAAVRRALDTLHPSDTFNIIDFADQATPFAPQPVPNTPANVARAHAHLTHLAAGGGTNQLAGIHAALSAPGDAMRLRYVVFLTDGYIGNESQVIGLVQREIGSARIFGFGIGSSVNRFLLDEVSHAGRGASEYILHGERVEAAVERFYQRIGRPYLTDIAVDFGSLAVDRVLPSPMPDLSTFEPLVVLGRYRSPGAGEVTIRGRLAGRPFERRVRVELPAVDPDGKAISRVWARERIEGLSRQIHFRGELPLLVDDIVQTALAHNLVSQYTSLLAIEDAPVDPRNQGNAPRRVVQPNEAPQGVNMAAAGGGQNVAQIVPPIYGPRVRELERGEGMSGGGGGAAGGGAAGGAGGAGGGGESVNSHEDGEGRYAMQSDAVSAAPGVYTVSRRGRGCAGCAVGDARGDEGAAALAMAAVAAALAAARRRKRS